MDVEGDSSNCQENGWPEPVSAPGPDFTRLLKFKVYRRRWFILFALCLLNCSNAMLWLTFAPIAEESASVLAVSLDDINWLSLVYMLLAIPLSFPCTWMLDTWGLQPTLILGTWLNMFGSVCRVVALLWFVPSSWRFPMVMTGQCVCAAAQPLVIFSPAKMAAVWFPQHQRATANMIASMSNPLGALFANLISPLIAASSGDLKTVLFVYSVPAVVVCVLATVGIRDNCPPTPPSASAETSNSEPFFKGIKLLLTNKAYLLLLVCFGSGVAIFTCFSSLLEQILCVKGYKDEFAGVCGALFILCGVLGAGLLGAYVDRSKKFVEATKVNLCLSALGCSAFAVISQLEGQSVLVAVVCSLFGLFGFAIYPVAMELCVECSYPVGEATSAGLIFIAGQVLSVGYMLLLQALTIPLADDPPSVCSGDDTLSWRMPLLVMAGLCSVGTCVFVCFFHTDYKRLRAEEEAEDKHAAFTHTPYTHNSTSHTPDALDRDLTEVPHTLDTNSHTHC